MLVGTEKSPIAITVFNETKLPLAHRWGENLCRGIDYRSKHMPTQNSRNKKLHGHGLKILNLTLHY